MLTTYCPACGGPLSCYLRCHTGTRDVAQLFMACGACPLASHIVYVDRVAYLDDVASIRVIDQLDDRAVLTPVTRTATPFTIWKES